MACEIPIKAVPRSAQNQRNILEIRNILPIILPNIFPLENVKLFAVKVWIERLGTEDNRNPDEYE